MKTLTICRRIMQVMKAGFYGRIPLASEDFLSKALIDRGRHVHRGDGSR